MKTQHAITPAFQPAGGRALSPGQKKFNTLIQRIDTQRALLAEWQASVPLYQQYHRAELEPLRLQFDAHLAELALRLEQHVNAKGWSKTERERLRERICELAESLMHNPAQAEAMKALFNRQSETDWDTYVLQMQGDMMAEVKAMAEHGLGIDLGDVSAMESPDELLARLDRELRERLAREQQAEQAHREQRRARRKPTAQQARAQADAESVSRSIREVYRQLASALHPDRETEPAERERKTALMQRVNQAYARKDLLSLLQLQLEIEQIDPAALQDIAADRLAHFIQVLGDQLRELQDEVQDIAGRFKMQFDFAPHERLTPKTLMKAGRQISQRYQVDVLEVQRQLRLLVDMRSARSWLKAQEEAQRHQDLLGMMDWIVSPRR
jgi:hypothetical protein